MMSPSPRDFCWVLKVVPQGQWIGPVVYAAIETRWQEARQLALALLGDEDLAPEIMESAIERTVAHLALGIPINEDDAAIVLSRFYKLEARRRRVNRKRLVSWNAAMEKSPETVDRNLNAIEAKLDLDKILQDTPADLRTALLMRYGNAERWSDVASQTGTTKEAIRKSCERHLSHLRKRFGIPDRSK